MSDQHPLANDLRDLLAALVGAAMPAKPEDAERARAEARRVHSHIRAEPAVADPASIKLDGLWNAAVRQAETPELDGTPLRVSQQMSAACPVTLSDLLAPELDLPSMEDRIRSAAATG